MLEGIKVLNKTEIMAVPEWVYIVGLICIVLIVVGMVFAFVSLSVDKIKTWIPLSIVIVGWVGFMFCNALDDNLTIKPTGKYEYQVTIDESVSMTEFYEKYEIVEVNGKIFTIIEKE